MHVKFQNNNIQHSLQKKNNKREIKKRNIEKAFTSIKKKLFSIIQKKNNTKFETLQKIKK